MTTANIHDPRVLKGLLHGEETRVWGDSAYAGQKSVIQEQAPEDKDFTQKKGSRHRKLTEQERSRNAHKSKVRAKVEHLFGIIKNLFGFKKVGYCGLDKNANHSFESCALANIVVVKKQLKKKRESHLQGQYA